MRKLLFTSILTFVTIAIFAQESTKSTADTAKTVDNVGGKNEIRLNLLNVVLGIPEISYERLFNDNSGAGLSVLVGIDDDMEYKFGVIPYYRMYFGNSPKKATGFFIEANAALMNVADVYSYGYEVSPNGNYISTRYEEKTLSFGMGAAAGGKFISKNGFVGELYFGVGRFFGKKGHVEVYPRMGITIGKRF